MWQFFVNIVHNTERTNCCRLKVAVGLFVLFCICSGMLWAHDDRAKYSLENPKYNSIIVASVGSHTITAQEFLLNYEFGPAFPKREQNSKREYLNYMIYEKLIALDGYRQGVDKTNDAKLSLAEMEGDLATEELYKRDVLSKVKISEESIQNGIAQNTKVYSVRWLYQRTNERIQDQVDLLGRGISFDSLFLGQISDTIKADDRSMSMTRFQIDMKNPDMGRILDTLPVQEVSAPIEAPDGFYLFSISDIQESPVLNQSDQIKMHEDVKRALIQHIADSLSDIYVQKIMNEHHPVIVRKTIDILQAYLAKIILSPDRFSLWNLDQRLGQRWGLIYHDTINPSFHLVEMSGNNFTVKDFLNWYHAREMNLKFDLSSPQSFFSSLEQFVWRMVRDKLLTRRAFTRGFQNTKNVKKQLAWWKDKIVYNIVKAGLQDSVRYSDELLMHYYDDHQKDFHDKNGKIIPFEKAKDDVLRAYYAFEITKQTVHRVLKLKEQYHIVVNDAALRKLSVDTENDPRAIDVYIAKTGGIFPRPAFPTIDYDWQTWN